MKTEKIMDVLQGIDINNTIGLAKFSDQIWAISNDIEEIRRQVSDAVFTVFIATNVIGIYKSGGGQAVIEENRALLPYISQAMAEIGLAQVSEATPNITNILELDGIDAASLHEAEYYEWINFVRGVPIGKFFTVTMEPLKAISQEERQQITLHYRTALEMLENSVATLWDYGCPDNEGWGAVSRYLEKHLQDDFWQ